MQFVTNKPSLPPIPNTKIQRAQQFKNQKALKKSEKITAFTFFFTNFLHNAIYPKTKEEGENQSHLICCNTENWLENGLNYEFEQRNWGRSWSESNGCGVRSWSERNGGWSRKGWEISFVLLRGFFIIWFFVCN